MFEIFAYFIHFPYLCNMKINVLVIFHRLWKRFKRHKYGITIIVFGAWLGYFDDNSFYQCYKQSQEIRDMQHQITDFRNQYAHDTKLLNELDHDPSAILKIARERYFMKAANEDVYIFSDKQQ